MSQTSSLKTSQTLQIQNEPLLPVDKTAERPLWVVLTIMAFLAALALVSSRMGARHYDGLQAELAGAATVQLTDVTTETRLETAQQAIQLIERIAPEANALRVNDADALSLIEPWIGENLQSGLPDGITLPVLITLSASTETQRETLRSAFNDANIPAIIDDHSQWSSEMSRTARAFSLGSWLILLLTFFAGTAASIFATSSAMAAQSKTVSVFAQVGAPDSFITRLFVMRAVKVGVISGFIGSAGALLFIGLFRLLRGPSENGLLLGLTPSLTDIFSLIALCVIFTIVCAVAAGANARQILRSSRLYT